MLNHKTPFTTAALVFCVLCCICPAVRSQQLGSAEESPLGRISWLVGHWIATGVNAAGEPTTVDLQVKWSSDKSSITMSCTQLEGTQIVGPNQNEKPEPQYVAIYTWDAGKKRIDVSENRANGDHFQGTVLIGGTDFVESGELKHASGAATEISIDYNQWAPGTLNITTTPTKGDSGATTAAENLVFLLQKP